MDEGQMQALAAHVVDAGFFTWDEAYLDPAPLPGHTLAVALPRRSAGAKRVFVNANAPPGFSELIRYLLDDVPTQVADARPYVPAEARVVASGPVPEAIPDPDPAWPAAAPDLASAVAGAPVTVDGENLAFLWDLVNQSPTIPHALPYNGQVYFVTIAVPNVSLCTGDPDPAFEIRWDCR